MHTLLGREIQYLFTVSVYVGAIQLPAFKYAQRAVLSSSGPANSVLARADCLAMQVCNCKCQCAGSLTPNTPVQALIMITITHVAEVAKSSTTLS